MKLNIKNEFGTLKSAVVCWAYDFPEYEIYKTNDPEFLKYHPYKWDKSKLLKQQEDFFNLLERYSVKLYFPKTSPHLTQQIYVRDTASVIGNKLYFAPKRKFKEREGEIEEILDILNLKPSDYIVLENEIEGGDIVIVDSNSIYLGHGSRTTNAAIKELSKEVQVKVFELGDRVMHLDTRLTLLPKNIALFNKTNFKKIDQEFVFENYDVIEVTDEETKRLGANIFCINPETIVVPTEHERIGKELRSKNFKIEFLDYDEPINMGGGFRCTTMPTERN